MANSLSHSKEPHRSSAEPIPFCRWCIRFIYPRLDYTSGRMGVPDTVMYTKTTVLAPFLESNLYSIQRTCIAPFQDTCSEALQIYWGPPFMYQFSSISGSQSVVRRPKVACQMFTGGLSNFSNIWKIADHILCKASIFIPVSSCLALYIWILIHSQV